MSSAGPVEAPAARPGAGARVLYVEDHPPDVALMADYLSGFEDLSLAVASSIDQAIELAAKIRPAVVLVDLDWLADRASTGLLARLRALPTMRAAQVIGLSNSADPKTRAFSRHLGCDRFFTKPLDLSALGDALGEMLPTAAA